MTRLRPGWFVALCAALLGGSAWLPWLTTSAHGGGRASAIGGTVGSIVLPSRFGAGQLIVLLSAVLIVTGDAKAEEVVRLARKYYGPHKARALPVRSALWAFALFVLVLVVRDMDQYTALTREVFFASNNVKRFKTLVSMSRVKVGLGVPVDIVDE